MFFFDEPLSIQTISLLLSEHKILSMKDWNTYTTFEKFIAVIHKMILIAMAGAVVYFLFIHNKIN